VNPVSIPLRVRRYDLGSATYQALLRDYLRGRLKLDFAKADDRVLADAVIRAADNRFAYVSFLADRRETGQVAAKEIGDAANRPRQSSDLAFPRLWRDMARRGVHRVG
jgi:hypothetical protein